MRALMELLFFAMLLLVTVLVIAVTVVHISDKKRLFLYPISDKNHDSKWSESIAVLEKGETNSIFEVLEEEPDLIYTSNSSGETILHVLAKSGMDEAIIISTCRRIREIVQKCRLKEVAIKKDTNGDTPLHIALKKRQQELACWLISLNRKAAYISNKVGVCARDVVIISGYSKVAEKLNLVIVGSRIIELHAGFSDMEMDLVRRDINSLNEPIPKWIEPIPRSARQAFIEASSGIIEPKEIQKYIDSFRGNILHWAATFQHLSVVELLKDFMSKSEFESLALEKNISGDLPLHLALEFKSRHHNNPDIAVYLIEVAPKAVLFLNRNGVSPLFYAIKLGYENVVKTIFQLIPGTSIESSLKKNRTNKASVVHAAIRYQNLGILDVIMKELPGSIDSLNERGWRPLSYAAYKGYLDGVTYFLNYFPECIVKYDRDGSPPMHKAVGGGHVSIVQKFLLSCPSSIYHLDSKGRSILHVAVIYRQADVFSYLNKQKEVKQIFHHQDNEGNTFMDLYNQLKNKREKT